jgi:hypothetical protein
MELGGDTQCSPPKRLGIEGACRPLSLVYAPMSSASGHHVNSTLVITSQLPRPYLQLNHTDSTASRRGTFVSARSLLAYKTASGNKSRGADLAFFSHLRCSPDLIQRRSVPKSHRTGEKVFSNTDRKSHFLHVLTMHKSCYSFSPGLCGKRERDVHPSGPTEPCREKLEKKRRSILSPDPKRAPSP